MKVYLFLLIALYFFIFQNSFCQKKIILKNLTCEYKNNPLGLDANIPRFAWMIESINQKDIIQNSYQIKVSTIQNDLKTSNKLFWDSGKITTGQSIQIPFNGKKLSSKQRYFWQVKVWTNKGESEWSEINFWETGLLSPSDWVASWIETNLKEDISKTQPTQYFRKEFKSNDNIISARAYITSHGLYEAFINGKRVGDALFTPGWTSYNKRLQYQVYDVTSLLKNGTNAIGVILGEGWYRGTLAWDNNRNIYGSQLALLMQVEIKYASGKVETIVTDESWKSSKGPILSSEIYNGEVYDARLEKKGWSDANFGDNDWKIVKNVSISKDNLIGMDGPLVRRIDEIKPLKLIFTPKGDTVLDLGQNMTGWVKLKVKGNKGTKITIRHAEVLDKNGNFYTENLRKANAQLEYILKGDGIEEIYEPHFTFMGFRYIAIKNWPGKIDLNNITGIVIHSDMEKTGSFECSNPLLNKLQHNIQWGQKGNFLDVPTDCPQRDERLGWTGDAEVFAPTASYNYNVAPFFTKWMKDVAADQLENGAIPAIIPDVLHGVMAGACGWADVATIIPYVIYSHFGDKQILEKQYPSMKAWVEFMRKTAGQKFIINSGNHFGDWLSYNSTDPGGESAYTDKDLLATAFFAYSTDILSKSAKIIGKEDEARDYEALHNNIKKAFQKEFITADARLSPNTQTAYALALEFDLVNEDQKIKAAERLANDIKHRGNHLSTGFLGTPHIAQALSHNGQLQVAYDLLLQESYPSWLFPVKMGATTIWERWDGIKSDSTFQDKGMNSFNHYAYGAIGDWMYTNIAGITLDPKNPGYKHFFVRPQPDKRILSAKGTLISPYGKIISDWKIVNGMFIISVTIPPNSSAEIKLPHSNLSQVREKNVIIKKGDGINEIQQENENVLIKLGSGNYEFTYPFSFKE